MRTTHITKDGECWEIVSPAHGVHAAQECGMWRVGAGVYSVLVAPHEALTIFTLLSMSSWLQG